MLLQRRGGYKSTLTASVLCSGPGFVFRDAMRTKHCCSIAPSIHTQCAAHLEMLLSAVRAFNSPRKPCKAQVSLCNPVPLIVWGFCWGIGAWVWPRWMAAPTPGCTVLTSVCLNAFSLWVLCLSCEHFLVPAFPHSLFYFWGGFSFRCSLETKQVIDIL